jgi:hypothetical protein
MHRSSSFLVAVVATLALSGGAIATEDAAKQHAELAKALTAAKGSLPVGLSAASSAGNPISAKFEVEDGKLQLV